MLGKGPPLLPRAHVVLEIRVAVTVTLNSDRWRDNEAAQKQVSACAGFRGGEGVLSEEDRSHCRDRAPATQASAFKAEAATCLWDGGF